MQPHKKFFGPHSSALARARRRQRIFAGCHGNARPARIEVRPAAALVLNWPVQRGASTKLKIIKNQNDAPLYAFGTNYSHLK